MLCESVILAFGAPRISRRVLAEQHLHLGQARQDFIGVICTDLRLSDALDHAVQQTRQVPAFSRMVIASGHCMVGVPPPWLHLGPHVVWPAWYGSINLSDAIHIPSLAGV